MRPAPLAFYAAATRLAEPLAAGLLQGRARRGKEDPSRLGERLGRAGRPRPSGPMVWLHGVSVGESLSLLPLAEALRTRCPDVTLLVTSGTRTAAELLARRLPEGAIHQYAPVDGPAAVSRFLDHWRPALGVLVESELWPNLILAARRRGVRLALVSARMTEESARGWAKAPASARALLSCFDIVLPQEQATAARLANLGARVGATLNLKLAGHPLPADPDELARLRGASAGRAVILAASTHPGEEAQIAEAFAAGRNRPALLVIAPRHPDRGPEIAALLATQGFVVARRAAGEPIRPETQVYVADTLGEMGLFFRLADVAVMGGSFAPGVGGHNPLEPARLARPVVTGPHVFNAAEVYAEMFEAVVAIEAADGDALARHLAGLLQYPQVARRIGEAGATYAARQGAAFDQALEHLLPLVPA